MFYTLIFVLIGITTLTVAYATLSITLKITGSAEFEDASWELVLKELPVTWDVDIEYKQGNTVFWGESKLLKKPTLTGTSLADFEVSLKNIGDGLNQNYVITNIGEVPAVLESIVYDDWIVDSSINDQDEIDLVYDNFDFYVDMYEIYFEDEEPVEWGTWIGEGDILCPGASFSIEIVTEYDDEAPRVPYKATTISDLGVEFNFEATDQNLCDGDTPITSNKDN